MEVIDCKYCYTKNGFLEMPINGTSHVEGFYLSNYGGVPLKIIDHEQDFTVNFIADSISVPPQLVQYSR